MTSRPRQILIVARERLIQARERWPQEQAWEPMLRESLLRQARTARRNEAQRSDHSIDSIVMRLRGASARATQH